jgi:hypothetical protein
MNYKDMVSLLPYHITACPEFVAVKAIKDATLSFCRRSGAYRATLDPITTIRGLFEYDIDLPKNTNLVEIHSATLGSNEITPETEQGANHANPLWRTEMGTPKSFIRPSNKKIFLVPVPEASNENITLYASLKPSLTATGIDTEFVENYVDGIMAGALANLFNAQDMPWANPQRAMKHEAEFQAHIQDASNKADGRNGPTRKLVRYGGL